jgi:hypothetical protein
VAGRRERGYVRSQDIGLDVLVTAPERGRLLRQEKDEASLLRECEPGFLNAFILRFVGDEGFFVTLTFQSARSLTFLPALVSQSLTGPQKLRT